MPLVHRCYRCGHLVSGVWDVCIDCAEGNHEAEQYLADAACSDTHSSDVDPGRVDPWSER